MKIGSYNKDQKRVFFFLLLVLRQCITITLKCLWNKGPCSSAPDIDWHSEYEMRSMWRKAWEIDDGGLVFGMIISQQGLITCIIYIKTILSLSSSPSPSPSDYLTCKSNKQPAGRSLWFDWLINYTEI
jgi:hypothetical protein